MGRGRSFNRQLFWRRQVGSGAVLDGALSYPIGTEGQCDRGTGQIPNRQMMDAGDGGQSLWRQFRFNRFRRGQNKGRCPATGTTNLNKVAL